MLKIEYQTEAFLLRVSRRKSNGENKRKYRASRRDVLKSRKSTPSPVSRIHSISLPLHVEKQTLLAHQPNTDTVA